LTNKETMALSFNGGSIEVGRSLSDYFSKEVKEKVVEVLTSDASCSIRGYRLSEDTPVFLADDAKMLMENLDHMIKIQQT